MSEAENAKRLRKARRYWNAAAPNFDDAPDHGLRDPSVRDAWTNLLKKWLPPYPAAVLDIGCGTGSLSIVLAGLGFEVTGIDLAPKMITLAEAKAEKAGYPIKFQVMDAARPQFSPQQFDGVVCRHLLWSLPEPKQVLQSWSGLLRPGGRLLLIEGFWHMGAGLHAGEVIEALPPGFTNISLENLSDQPDLWGGPVSDERYLIAATGLSQMYSRKLTR